VADELEELNGHILAYLETMALTLLGDCGGDPAKMEANRQAREGAALRLLKHVEESREDD